MKGYKQQRTSMLTLGHQFQDYNKSVVHNESIKEEIFPVRNQDLRDLRRRLEKQLSSVNQEPTTTP